MLVITHFAHRTGMWLSTGQVRAFAMYEGGRIASRDEVPTVLWGQVVTAEDLEGTGHVYQHSDCGWHPDGRYATIRTMEE